MCKHLLDHLERHNLLTTLQHGFRKAHHSCESQLLITLDDLYATFNKKIQTDVSILDFSRAFGTVPHKHLLRKLAHYGIQGRTSSWIRAFLTGCSMTVNCRGWRKFWADACFLWSSTENGPQTTVFSWSISIICHHKPPKVPASTSSQMSASCTGESRIWTTKQFFNRTLIVSTTGLPLGNDLQPKCYITHINRGRRLDKFYQMCGTILGTVTQAKYLGVTISDDLHWHQQTNLVAKKANTTLHMISRNLRYCPRKTRSSAYCTIVRPKLEYCTRVWDPFQQQDIDALEHINRWAAPVVYNKTWRERGVSPTALLKDLGWDTLSDHRRQQRLSLMYHITHGLVAVSPTCLEKLVTPQDTHLNIRQLVPPVI